MVSCDSAQSEDRGKMEEKATEGGASRFPKGARNWRFTIASIFTLTQKSDISNRDKKDAREREARRGLGTTVRGPRSGNF